MYKLYDRHGTLLYVGVTDDVVRQLTEHQRGTRLQWGGRLDDRSRWWGDVVHVTVEHLPAGTTEWEAKLYGRSQLALGPRYNTEADDGPEPARAARLEAEQRDAERHDRARQLHARHDGVTRLVRPTLSIVPRFPNAPPAPEPAPLGAHDAHRPPAAGNAPEREPAFAGSRSGSDAGPGHPGRTADASGRTSGAAPAPAAVADRPGPQGAVATATRPAPAAPAPGLRPEPEPAPDDDDGVDHSLEHQGRYLLLAMAGVFLGIVLLSLDQMLR